MINLNTTQPTKNASRSIRTKVIIVVSAIVITAGVITSIIFARTIERFFWEVRTDTVILEVDETSNRLLKTDDITNWQSEDPQKRISSFVQSIKRELPNILAVKVYTNEGIVAWSDFQYGKAGSVESLFEDGLRVASETGRYVDIASDLSRKELNRPNLLEIYIKLKDSKATPIGYIEFYLENSDIAAFVSKVHYAIIGSVIVSLIIGLSLVRLALRKQDDIIVRQAYELSNIVEQSPFGIYTIDTKGSVVSINPHMLKIINHQDPSKIIGRNCHEFPGIQKICTAVPLERVLQGEAVDIETTSIDSKGNEIHYRYRGIPLFSDNNKTVIEVLFTVEDITERKEVEENLASHAKMLEEGVAERTKELQHKVAELEQFQRLTIGRELRMTELKAELEKAKNKLKELGIKEDSGSDLLSNV